MLNNSWPKAILLDFYGTVVEEIQVPVQEICTRISAASSAGLNINEIVSYWGRVFSGLCYRSYGDAFHSQRELELQSLQESLQHFNISLDAAILSPSLSKYRAHPTLFPESRTVITQCRVPICLATNIDNSEIQSAVRSLSLNFDYIVTSEDCRAYKPRQEIFKKALSLLGLSAAEVLHVGDSWQSDVQGAKNLDIRVIWINRRRRPIPDTNIKADYMADDLTGLLNILNS